jgi:GPI mannosyltransferase 3
VGDLRVVAVLVLAFAARFAVGLATDGVLQPDEAMQYLEQAHRLVFGAGMVPWDYEYGVRSWVPALSIALPLEVVRVTGFDTPAVYQAAVKAMLCLASLAIPYSAYRLASALVSARAGWLALLFTSFWYELVSYGHRSTIDAMTAYPAFAALALACAEPRRRVTIGCGLLAGLTFVMRFHLTPVLGVIGLVALLRWRARAWPAVVAALVMVVAGGALDAYTWNVWFSSITNTLQIHSGQGVASIFGTQPVYWYLWSILVLTGGLVILGLFGLVVSRHTLWPLLAVGAAVLITFSLVGHKETRFVFLLTPIWLVGLAALAAHPERAIAALRSGQAGRGVSFAFVALFAVISAGGLLYRLPYENTLIRRHIARVPVREAYRALAQRNDVVAVLDASGDSGWYRPPYYDLHHDVPVYWPISNGFQVVAAQPSRFVSHVIAQRRAEAPLGFRELERVGPLVIWRRNTDPEFTDEPFGYERRIHALQPVKTPPTVVPRW